jgi:flagellar basal body rod protein FlgG
MPVEEMVNMISASRSYQNNVEVMNTAQSAAAEDAADSASRFRETHHVHAPPRA